MSGRSPAIEQTGFCLRMARFEREAKVLAALNHPNIAQIYGVEHHALVMELDEGEIRSRRVDPSALEDV